MTVVPVLPLSELANFISGGTPSKARRDFYGGPIPWITGADIDVQGTYRARTGISQQAIESSAAPLVDSGALMLVTRTAVGKVAVAEGPVSFSQDITGIQPDPDHLDPYYLRYYLSSRARYLQTFARGATIKGITRNVISNLEIPLPPLEAQRHAVQQLDHASTVRRGEKQGRKRIESLPVALFMEAFGDPGANPRGWPEVQLGEVATKFSDGPFGSNLKSSHYTPHGIRVVRLQNIGVEEFIDADRAYISEDHFHLLHKHECVAGDVLVATLGNPNLRACILPDYVARAINKADCVQVRVNEEVACADYVCALLNQPGTLARARSIMSGQTRTRISMGRLRALKIPLPPIELQQRFASQLSQWRDLRSLSLRRSALLEELVGSLQSRTFEAVR